MTSNNGLKWWTWSLMISLLTRKALCILMVAEQKTNLVRSNRRNSSPKNWRKAWSVEEKGIVNGGNTKMPLQQGTKLRKAFMTFLPGTNTLKYPVYSRKPFKTDTTVSFVKCSGRLAGYLWNVNGSVAGQYHGWFFEDILDTFPTGLYACLTIQTQIGRPLEDCSKREWRGYLAETDL